MDKSPVEQKAVALLQDAINIIKGDRRRSYGDSTTNLKLVAGLWSTYLQKRGTNLEAIDVSLMMILMKVAREISGEGAYDNLLDIAGYASIGEQARTPRPVYEATQCIVEVQQ